MKRIMSIIFAVFMVAVCSIAGGVFLTGSTSMKDNSSSKEVNNSVSTTATGDWNSYYASSYAGGSGTSSSPYLISTPEQLARMSYRTNLGYETGSYFKLTTDIDISAHYWTPIGAKKYFTGNFDGDDYCIIGMNINTGTALSASGVSVFYGAGLFGTLYGSASAHNFSLSKAYINWSASSSQLVFQSFVCCMAVYGSSVRIYDVRVVDSYMTLTVSQHQGIYMGGILANGCGIQIQRCCVIGSNIYGGSSSSKAADGFVGGLVGSTDTNSTNGASSISDCFFSGHIDVYCAQYTGGLVGELIGFSSSARANLERCYYVDTGTAWLGAQYAGGLVGRLYSGGGIRSCFAYYSSLSTNSNSNVTTSYKGALVGYAYATSSLNAWCRYSCWYASSSSTAWCAYTASSTSYISSVNCRSYTSSTLPKAAVTSSGFYASSSYLYDSGYTTWSSSTWREGSTSTTDVRYYVNNGYPILNGSWGYVMCNKDDSVSSTTTGLSNIQAASNRSAQTTSSGTFHAAIYGQTVQGTASASSTVFWKANGNIIATGSSITTVSMKSIVDTLGNPPYTRITATTSGTFTLTYDVNGGNALSATSKTVNYGSTYGTLPTPSRTGYTFDGWYTAASGGTQVTSSSTYNIAGNSTIYAHWTIRRYTIYFYKYGSGITSVSGAGTYDYGTVVTLSYVVNSGYTVSWGDGYTSTSTSRTITVTSTKSYSVTGTPNTYTVNFDYNGATNPSPTVSVSNPDIMPTYFELNSDGYWESQNKGYHNSYAYAKAYFYTRVENAKVTFECISSGESNCDYGIVSQLDCELEKSNSNDSDKLRDFSGDENQNRAINVDYFVHDPGEHFVTIKYIKDVSVNNGEDCFKFRIVSGVNQDDWDVYHYGMQYYYNADDGFWTASNMYADNDESFAMAKVEINADYDGQEFILQYSRYSPYSGSSNETVLSNLDEDNLTFNPNMDGYTLSCDYSAGLYEERFSLPSGKHYFWIKSYFSRPYHSLGEEEWFKFRILDENAGEESPSSGAFVWTDDIGGWRSTNHEDGSYSLAVVRFVTDYDGQEVVFYGMNSSEEGYDYGMFSYLDEMLPADPEESGNVYYSFQGVSSGDEQQVSYSVDYAGEHFICVKYRKDGSVSNNDDCFYFRVEDIDVSVGTGINSFIWDENNYAYKSTNHSMDTYSMAIVRFVTDYDGQYVTFTGWNSSAYNDRDFGMFGVLDTMLPDDCEDSGYIEVSFEGISENHEQQVSYYVDYAGEHFICVKFIKHHDEYIFDDCFYFRAEDIDITVSSSMNEGRYSVSSIVPYWVESQGAVGTKYNFTLGSDGYYINTNHSSSTFSLMRVNFTTTYTNQVVTFECYNNTGGYYWNYGMLSNLDTALTFGCQLYTSPSYGIYKSFQNVTSFEKMYVSYVVPSAGNHFVDVQQIQWVGGGSYANAYFKFKCVGSDLFTVTYNSTYGSLPVPKRTNYTFDGWYTSATGGTKVVSSTTYTTVGNSTLYARWTRNKVNVTVNLMVISKDGETVLNSNECGTIDVAYTGVEGANEIAKGETQSTATKTYAAAMGLDFVISNFVANENYVFVGVSTASTPSDAIKNPTTVPQSSFSSTPSGSVTYYVYFKQVSPNVLKYDETDKYFYFEDGYYPQSRATNESTLNTLGNSYKTGETINYNDGTNNVELPVYSYGSDRYVKVTINGTSAWFKFEPIRWRISDYGVAYTERNISKYTVLYNLRNYTSSATNFTAVSDLILGVGSMHNTRTMSEGTSVTSMIGYQNIENTTEGCSISFGYAKSDKTIGVDNYSTTSQNNAIKITEVSYSAPLRIASLSEIETVGLTNKQARASDMAAFILGVDKNNASYWTRDLSNLGSGIAITASGTKSRPWLNEVLGMRFAYTFSEGSNVGNVIYDRLDYIQSTGTQYIDTGFIPNQDTSVEIVFSTNSVASSEVFFYGAGGTHDTDNTFESYTYLPGFQFNYGSVRQLGTSLTASANTKYKVLQSKNNWSVENCETNQTSSGSFSTRTFTCPGTLYLLALNRANQLFLSDAEMKLYECKIWDNGVLVRDLVPVINSSTGETGLWDNVTEKFYGNAGTGTFVAGMSSKDESSAMGTAVAEYAKQFVGNRYVWGGTSLTNGCDTSGFTMAVYNAFGISLPHSMASQKSVGTTVAVSSKKIGDLIFFNYEGSEHVGIYCGDGYVVASLPSSGIRMIKVDSITRVMRLVS